MNIKNQNHGFRSHQAAFLTRRNQYSPRSHSSCTAAEQFVHAQRTPPPSMKRVLAVGCCCACWWIRGSTSFFVPKPVVARIPAPNRQPNHVFSATGPRNSNVGVPVGRLSIVESSQQRLHSNSRPSRGCSATTTMSGTESCKGWLTGFASAVTALSVLVGASAVAPVSASAAGPPGSAREPVVEALVQLPDDEADWTK